MKHFLLIVSCCLMTGVASAQHFVGARVGYGFHQMKFNVSPAPEQNWTPGLAAGFVFRSMATPHLGIQIEVLAEEKGWHLFPDTDNSYLMEELHATLPVQTVVVIGKGRLQFVLSAGAFGTYILGQEVVTTGVSPDYPVRFDEQPRRDWQYGLLGGGGPMIQVGKRSRFQLEGRYYYTLSNRLEPNLTQNNTFDVSQQQSVNVALLWLFRLRELESPRLKLKDYHY